MHTLLPDFKFQAKAIRQKRFKRRFFKVFCSFVIIVLLPFLWIYFFPSLISVINNKNFAATQQHDTIEHNNGKEFILEVSDEIRDPIFIASTSSKSNTSNKFELRFRNVSQAAEVAGTVFFVEDRMIGSSAQLTTTLPALPQDYALLGSASIDEKTSGTVVTNQQIITNKTLSDYGNDGAGWETFSEKENLPVTVNKDGVIKKQGSSFLHVLPPSKRFRTSEDYFLKILSPQKIQEVLLKAQINQNDLESNAKLIGKIFEINDLQAGSIVAFRIEQSSKDPSSRKLTQFSLLNLDKVTRNLTRLASDTFVETESPWSHIGLKTYISSNDNKVDQKRFRILDGIYSAGVRNDIPPHIISETIVQMARTYDLSQFITPDDSVSLIYTSSPRDTKRGTGHVLYASVRHGSKALSCYVLKPGRLDDFTCMTEKDSIQLNTNPIGYVTPVNGVLRSRFGPRRHPILNTILIHKGVDWAAPSGTPIHAAMSGRINYAAVRGGYGNYISINHGKGITTAYAHMSRYASGMTNGRYVKAGDVIGYVGTTGLSTGPHLHFEVRVNGKAVDPLSFNVTAQIQEDDPKAGLVNKIIQVESGGRAHLKNPLSSATGLGQFIESTWLHMMRSYRPDLVHNLSRSELLELRKDPTLSHEMVGHLIIQNEDDLRRAGVNITAGNLYLAHFLGSAGAIKALKTPLDTKIIDAFGSGVVKANPHLRGKDIRWIINWAARKMARAKGIYAHSLPQLPAAERIKNSRYRGYSQAVDNILEVIKQQKQPG